LDVLRPEQVDEGVDAASARTASCAASGSP
jgi:hypothetical protein